MTLLSACGESERPGTRNFALPAVDGAAHDAEARIFTSPAGFPLPFTTYLPPGLEARASPADSGGALTFSNRGAPGDPGSASVHLFVTPPATTERRARLLVRDAVERLLIPGPGRPLQQARMYPWAVEQYEVRSRGTRNDRIGRFALGRRNGRWFLLSVQYPVTLHRWFAPRADLVIDEWEWADGERPRRLRDGEQ